MGTLSNSLWAKAMADARTNVEAIIEEYLTRRTRLKPTGIAHRRYCYRQPTSKSLGRSGARRGPGRQISSSPWPAQNGCRTKPSAIQSMPCCSRRQSLPEAPSSNSCTTTDGGLYESVYYFFGCISSDISSNFLLLHSRALDRLLGVP